MAKAKSTTEVFLFIPNLVGYLRIIFCALSYYFAFTNPVLTIILYFFGAGFDAIDGVAARHFDQCSKLGQLLDMLTDRMGTLVLFIVIAIQDPSLWGLWASFIVLDIVSHWCQMFVSLSEGKTTHKGSSNAMLNTYYSFPILFIACCGNEFCIMAIYMLQTPQFADSTIWYWIFVSCFPIFVYKQLMNVVQLQHNMELLAQFDVDPQYLNNKHQE